MKLLPLALGILLVALAFSATTTQNIQITGGTATLTGTDFPVFNANLTTNTGSLSGSFYPSNFIAANVDATLYYGANPSLTIDPSLLSGAIVGNIVTIINNGVTYPFQGQIGLNGLNDLTTPASAITFTNGFTVTPTALTFTVPFTTSFGLDYFPNDTCHFCTQDDTVFQYTGSGTATFQFNIQLINNFPTNMIYQFGLTSATYNFTDAPEPATTTACALGLAALAAIRFAKRRKV